MRCAGVVDRVRPATWLLIIVTDRERTSRTCVPSHLSALRSSTRSLSLLTSLEYGIAARLQDSEVRRNESRTRSRQRRRSELSRHEVPVPRSENVALVQPQVERRH